jgi:hypothetical protein
MIFPDVSSRAHNLLVGAPTVRLMGVFHRIAGHVGDRAVADLIRGFGRFAGDRLTPGPAFDGVQKRTIIPGRKGHSVICGRFAGIDGRHDVCAAQSERDGVGAGGQCERQQGECDSWYTQFHGDLLTEI